jgi:hypothetical protein
VTTEEDSQLASLSEIIGFVRRHFVVITLGLILGGFLGYQGSTYLPKTYKSKAILSIQSGYFHHPLISDVVAEAQDPAEMGLQRTSLLRLALHDAFLESLHQRFFSKRGSTTRPDPPFDPETVASHIDYFFTNPSTFQITVAASSAEIALIAANEVLSQALSTFKQHRIYQLQSARAALEMQASLLEKILSQARSASTDGDLDKQMTSLRTRLSSLQRHLSETHPDVVSVKEKIRTLQQRSRPTEPGSPLPQAEIQGVFLSPMLRSTTLEILGQLLQRLNSLNVVLAMERTEGWNSYIDIIERPRLPRSPFSPKPPHFLLIGATVGFVIALFAAIARELHTHSKIAPKDAEFFLQAPLLGELPPLNLTPQSRNEGGAVHKDLE